MAEKYTVLVVDDEESIRDSCTQVLTKAGYVCESAVDGIQALDRVSELNPDILLLDLKMPGLDGLDVLDRVTGSHPTMVCIVITGYATIESAVDAMKRGAFDFLPKPFTPEELRLIINRGSEQRRLLVETTALREEKERMKQYFITIVTHELRSPLILVKQYLDLVLGGSMGTVDATAGELLRGAQGTLDGLLDLIADWLKLSRISAGDIAGSLADLDMGTVLDKALLDMKAFADEKQITLTLDPLPESRKIRGHAESLEAVFKNLLSNAIKYNRAGGSIRVTASSADGRLRIDVSDTGIGIPESELGFVFEEFFRVKSSQTAEIAGTGLGLSIVRKVLEGHGGSVEIESKQGEGTTISAFLPLVGGAR